MVLPWTGKGRLQESRVSQTGSAPVNRQEAIMNGNNVARADPDRFPGFHLARARRVLR